MPFNKAHDEKNLGQTFWVILKNVQVQGRRVDLRGGVLLVR